MDPFDVPVWPMRKGPFPKPQVPNKRGMNQFEGEGMNHFESARFHLGGWTIFLLKGPYPERRTVPCIYIAWRLNLSIGMNQFGHVTLSTGHLPERRAVGELLRALPLRQMTWWTDSRWSLTLPFWD